MTSLLKWQYFCSRKEKSKHEHGKKTEDKEAKSTKKKAKPAAKKNAASKVDKALEEANEALETEKEKYLRLFAEFENYKKRTSKERIELFKTAGQEVISSMLPIVDDFNRALKEAEKQENSADFVGFRLISNKLNETLKSKGLVAIEVNAGDAFDAEKHEAITQIPAGEDQSGKIVDVTEQGYQLGEKIIRYPKVVVGQ